MIEIPDQPDLPGLAQAVNESLRETLMRNSTLYDVGAHQDPMAEIVLPNTKVVFYDVDGDWEIDINSTKGSIHFNVPMGDIGVEFDDSYAHRRVVAGLRYLLRDYGRDELLNLIDEAVTVDAEYDEDGWPR
jgi:hypothetical protein